MPPISRAAFARRLCRLDAEGFAAFVAALYRARGWAVSRDGTRLHLRDGGRTRILAIHHEPRLHLRSRPITAEDVDAVVTNSQAAAKRASDRVIGPAELWTMALYAIDRTRASRLVSEHLGQPLIAPATDYSLRTGLADRAAMRTLVAIVGALTLFAGLSAGLIGPGVIPGGGHGQSAVAVTPAPITAEDASIGDARTTAVSTSTPAESTPVAHKEYPKGLSPDGIADPTAIAMNHARLLGNHSYELRLVRREYTGDDQVGVHTERLIVASPTRYVSSIDRVGQLSGQGPLVSNISRYANGEFIYSRTWANGSVQYDRSPIVTSLGSRNEDSVIERHSPKARIERYLRWALTVRESRIKSSYEQNGTDYYWIVGHHDPYPGIENTTIMLLIDERGLVYGFVHSYNPSWTDRRVIAEFRYFLRDVTVKPPIWYGTARNHTPTLAAVGAGNGFYCPASGSCSLTFWLSTFAGHFSGYKN